MGVLLKSVALDTHAVYTVLMCQCGCVIVSLLVLPNTNIRPTERLLLLAKSSLHNDITQFSQPLSRYKHPLTQLHNRTHSINGVMKDAHTNDVFQTGSVSLYASIVCY